MAYDDRTPLGKKIVQGLQEFSDALKRGRPLAEQLTCRKVELRIAPQPYSAAQVKETRELLHVSQPIFAQFLGVSTKAVQKWERGEETPQPIACRFMDEIRHDPKRWQERLLQCLVPKANSA